MNNQEKLEAIKVYLQQQGITCWVGVKIGETGIIIDLLIPKYCVAVHVGQDDNWYQVMCRFTHPVFIRDNDTKEFCIEKVQNTILKHQRLLAESSNRYHSPERLRTMRQRKNFRKQFWESLNGYSIINEKKVHSVC